MANNYRQISNAHCLLIYGVLSVLICLLPVLAVADEEHDFPLTGIRPSYVSVGAATPTPSELKFDFGVGPYLQVGWNTPIGLIELERFYTTRPAEADWSYNVNQKLITKSGSTDYDARASLLYWGKLFYLGDSIYGKLRLGIADYKYTAEYAGTRTTKTGRSYLTFGGGIVAKMNERFFFVLEYTYLDELMSNANIGVLFKL